MGLRHAGSLDIVATQPTSMRKPHRIATSAGRAIVAGSKPQRLDRRSVTRPRERPSWRPKATRAESFLLARSREAAEAEATEGAEGAEGGEGGKRLHEPELPGIDTHGGARASFEAPTGSRFCFTRSGGSSEHRRRGSGRTRALGPGLALGRLLADALEADKWSGIHESLKARQLSLLQMPWDAMRCHAMPWDSKIPPTLLLRRFCFDASGGPQFLHCADRLA